jgi:hypothetical protein
MRVILALSLLNGPNWLKEQPMCAPLLRAKHLYHLYNEMEAHLTTVKRRSGPS